MHICVSMHRFLLTLDMIDNLCFLLIFYAQFGYIFEQLK